MSSPFHGIMIGVAVFAALLVVVWLLAHLLNRR